MKIQKGIVKYMNRSDIVCAYGITDDGKQYYFLDETDTKKLQNGNRIASTALVEAIDPMVKAKNVGVIDENGAVVIPFENKTIRPVNDNVLVVEKADPISPSVLEALRLKNDPDSAATLVSTAATIKDKVNALAGVEGKYLFNDQFSEATLCDISGNNLVGGESFSFICMVNDKLLLSKNTPDVPVMEFSLTTYQTVPCAPQQTIDVSAAAVDPQVVENALSAESVDNAAQAEAAPAPSDVVTGEVASEGVVVAPPAAAPMDGVVPGADVAQEAEAPKEMIMQYIDTVPSVADTPAEEQTATTEQAVGDVPTEAAPAPSDVVAIPDEDAVASDVASASSEVSADSAVDSSSVQAAAVPGADAMNSADYSVPTDTVAPTYEEATQDSAVSGEFSTSDGAISDDLKSFTGGVPVGEENADTNASETVDLPTDIPVVAEDDAEAVADIPAPAEEAVASTDETVVLPAMDEVATETVDASAGDTSTGTDAETSVDAGAEAGMDTEVVESTDEHADASSEDAAATDEVASEEVASQEGTGDATEEIPVVEDNDSQEIHDVIDTVASEDTPAAEEVASEDVQDSVDLPDLSASDTSSDSSTDSVAEKESHEETPLSSVFSDKVLADTTEEEEVKTGPVPIDAETVLAAVDRDGNGIVDHDQERIHSEFASPYTTPAKEDYSNYSSGIYSDGGLGMNTPTYHTGYQSFPAPLTEVKPDKITYDDYVSPVRENIMADVARSMSELMRQNKEQRSIIAQYQSKVDTLESQARILSENNKALSGRLRSLDEATGRLEARNQSLEARLRDQAETIATQKRKLKEQVEGNQDLERLLADAKTLLGNDTGYGYGDSYHDGESYYRRAA